jgi:RNA polymerase sigma-70 factor, ECF subfamily
MQSAAAPATGDEAIHELLRGGEHGRAFARLVERYESKVYRLCCALLRDRAQAQDAAQESLVRIWKALPGYDGRAALGTWIYAITRNRCLTVLGRRRDFTSLEAGHVAAQTTAPEEPDDARELLRTLVGTLPERYRRVVTLFYYEERSVAEVAEMLAMPEGTVKTLLFRARALLAEQLKRRGLYDSRAWLGAES